MRARAIVGVALTLAAAAAAAGDAQRGARLYEQRCGGCHSVDENRVGPAHRGVFGRRAGGMPGFAYSRALAQSALVWNAETLDRWLANPEATVPGQAMGYRVEDGRDRADLIAYLKRLAAPRCTDVRAIVSSQTWT